MQGTLDRVVDRAASLHHSRPAVVDGPTRRTYADLARRVRGLGSGLADIGLRPGEVVGSLQLNSAEHLECWLGLPYHGFVLNDLNLRLAPPELAFMLDDCATAALVVDRAHVEVGRQLMAECPSLRHLIVAGPRPDARERMVWWEDLVKAEACPAPSLDGDTVASISYTGGTTGRPKGVVLSHANLVENAKHVLIAMGHRTGDRYLHAAPMFHSGDGLHTYATTWVGATHVIIPFFDPDAVTRVVEQEKVTLTVLVPTMVNMVVNHRATPERDLSSLRFVLYGASPMPAALQRRAMELIPADWAQGYGLTEAAPLVSFLSPEDHLMGLKGEEPYATRLASAGTPVVGVEAEVRRPDGSRADADEIGEIWVRGPNVMSGYWNRPEETAAAITADGWLRTGDVAKADADGYLYIVDRLHDVIITGGENVYSTEVENALYSHAAVLEAAVVAVPDDTWGERVHAIVVLRPGEATTRRQLVGHCRTLLAGFKVPRSVEVREGPLPKTGAGKIAKRLLRQPFWEGHDRQVH